MTWQHWLTFLTRLFQEMRLRLTPMIRNSSEWMSESWLLERSIKENREP